MAEDRARFDQAVATALVNLNRQKFSPRMGRNACRQLRHDCGIGDDAVGGLATHSSPVSCLATTEKRTAWFKRNTPPPEIDQPATDRPFGSAVKREAAPRAPALNGVPPRMNGVAQCSPIEHIANGPAQQFADPQAGSTPRYRESAIAQAEFPFHGGKQPREFIVISKWPGSNPDSCPKILGAKSIRGREPDQRDKIRKTSHSPRLLCRRIGALWTRRR